MVIIDDPHSRPVMNLMLLFVLYRLKLEAMPSIIVDRKKIENIIKI